MKLNKNAVRVFSKQGFEIYFLNQPAKRNGKDRVLFYIRQSGKKGKWTLNYSLGWSKCADVSFVKEQDGNN